MEWLHAPTFRDAMKRAVPLRLPVLSVIPTTGQISSLSRKSRDGERMQEGKRRRLSVKLRARLINTGAIIVGLPLGAARVQ
jgi:hypothetical protein